MHNFRGKIAGLLEFSDSEDEGETNRPNNADETLAIDARAKTDDTDIPEDQSIQQKRAAQMFEGMLQFSDSEDEGEDKFQLQTCGFTSSIEETVDADGTDVFVDAANELLSVNKRVTYLVFLTSMRTIAN